MAKPPLHKETRATEEGASTTKPLVSSGETHFQSIVSECNRLAELNPPYVFEGEHGSSPVKHKPSSLDCSSAVSAVLQGAGYEVPTEDSTFFMNWGNPGPGKVTIWAGTDHVFLMFANKCFAWSCPGCENGWQPLDNYGPHEHPSNAGPYVARHPADLGGPAGEVVGSGSGATTIAGFPNISKAAAISSYLDIPGTFNEGESLALKGTRSLMNDQPLLPFVEQLCQGSLRNFQSMPNGNFYAFIPDFFGGLTGRQAYWEIHDIEILSGNISLNDDNLATHVYIVGDTNADQVINVVDKVQTSGCVTVLNAFMADFLTGINSPAISKEGKTQVSKSEQNQYDSRISKVPSLAEKGRALNFLQRYGARPFYEEAPMIRSHYFEMFVAYQKFCLLWSEQFEAQFEFTFMPELIPGGLVAFPDYGIQCYINEVQHTGSYSEGFRTIANLIAPSTFKNGRKNVQAGMIRAGIFNPEKV